MEASLSAMVYNSSAPQTAASKMTSKLNQQLALSCS